jgi:hypothetical protein
VPWLMAADALIHNSCTTALESCLIGTPPIAYRPVESERFDMYLPNSLSYCAADLDGVTKLLDAALHGSIPDDRESAARKRELLDRHVASRSGPLASERIVDFLEEFEAKCRDEKPPAAWRRATGRLNGAVRNAQKHINAFLPEHNNNKDYVKHVCPDITLEDVEVSIMRLRKTLGRFSDVLPRPVSPQVFELASRNAE